MSFTADLHIHSPYSRGSSTRMLFDRIQDVAFNKGIDLMGTGDCFHPQWKDAINNMEEEEGSGFLYYWNKEVQFVPTVEVSLEWLNMRIHMLMVFKNMNAAERVEKQFSRYCMNMDDDGRPVAKLMPEELMDMAKGSLDNDALIIPAHCLTPWFGIMGNNNHLLDIREVLSIDPDAVETGLSANKRMIRQLPHMDKVPLVSFSDAHSLHNIGREVTIFNEEFSWDGLVRAILKNNIDTVEYPPALGKYHITGHRGCNYKRHSQEDCWGDLMCPVCGKRLTVGVEQRVLMLKVCDVNLDENYLIPLIQLINYTLDREKITNEAISIYNLTLGEYKEIELLCTVPLESTSMRKEIRMLIESIRNKHIKIIPGYDGVYGTIIDTYGMMDKAMREANQLKMQGKDYQSAWDRVVMMDKLICKGDMVMTPEDERVFY